jgi:predicted GNAT family N-acyltransferase
VSNGYRRAAMEVRPVRDAAELRRALALRVEVFCGEQGVAVTDERDGRDGEATHLVAVDGERVVGTCRLLFVRDPASLGRLVVERASRRRGIGSALLRQAAAMAEEAGVERIRLQAQVGARELYAGEGYVELGEPFVQAGIHHVTMERALA